MTHAIKILQEHNFKHHGSKQTWEQAWKDAQRSGKLCQSAGTPYMLTKNPVRSTTRTSRRYLQSFKIRSCQSLTKRKAMTTQEATTTNQILTTTMPLQFYFNANQHDLLAPRTCARSCLPSVIQASPVTNFAPRVCSVSLPSLSSLSHLPIEFSVLSGYFGAATLAEG